MTTTAWIFLGGIWVAIFTTIGISLNKIVNNQ